MSNLEDKIVKSLFKDLRNRNYLKWVFSKRPGAICDSGCRSLDKDVQKEIKQEWRRIIREEIDNHWKSVDRWEP